MLKLAILAVLFVGISCRSYYNNNNYYYTTTTTTTRPSAVFTPSICSAGNGYCYNGGTCSNSGVSISCRCPFGYTGPRCEQTVDACTSVQCTNAYCTTINSNEWHCESSYSYTSYSQETAPYTLASSGCDQYNLCQNGGKCYVGYNSQNNLTYGCSCPSGYTGLNCEQQYAYGVQVMPQSYYYGYYSGGSSCQSDKLKKFGQKFLLLNSEITDDNRNITRVEFENQQEGEFLIAFVKFPGCGGANEPSCAQLINDQFQQNSNDGNWTGFPYQAQLNAAFTTASFSLHTENTGFTSINLPGGFKVDKGTMLAVTQLDGIMGSPIAYTTNKYPDFFIDVDEMDGFTLTRLNLTDIYQNQYTTYNACGQAQAPQTPPPTPKWACPLRLVDSTKILTTSASDASNKCRSAVCVNGGTCNWDDTTSTYTCSCPAGTSGVHCQNR